MFFIVNDCFFLSRSFLFIVDLLLKYFWVNDWVRMIVFGFWRIVFFWELKLLELNILKNVLFVYNFFLYNFCLLWINRVLWIFKVVVVNIFG